MSDTYKHKGFGYFKNRIYKFYDTDSPFLGNRYKVRKCITKARQAFNRYNLDVSSKKEGLLYKKERESKKELLRYIKKYKHNYE